MTWTADDIRTYHLPENRDRGPGGDYAKFRQFQQAVARIVAEQEARIDELQRQVSDPDNRRTVDHAVDLLTRAQDTVEETIRQADEYSRNVQNRARTYYDQLCDQAAQVLAKANQEAEHIRLTVAAGHGNMDAGSAHALAQQLAITDTLTTILRGLVQNLETTRASLAHLRAGVDPHTPAEATSQYLPWPEGAANSPESEQA